MVLMTLGWRGCGDCGGCREDKEVKLTTCNPGLSTTMLSLGLRAQLDAHYGGARTLLNSCLACCKKHPGTE